MSTARILPILERNQYDDFEFDDLQEAGRILARPSSILCFTLIYRPTRLFKLAEIIKVARNYDRDSHMSESGLKMKMLRNTHLGDSSQSFI